ncbi:intermembrane transport protein PqiB [Acidocella sp.]|uniref:PqiB family protein n=1 Tax=Acidocella sp. TaxID=50710 RepID=UPI003CFFE5BC
MSNQDAPETPSPTPPRAKLRRQSFQMVWLVPIVAAIIAGYLGYRTIMEQGPLLTLTFTSADGLQAGQTQVKYKAVALGTVESIDLAKDNTHVIVKVRMNHVGTRFLNSNARYWVVRPRLNFSDMSSFETIVSGVYISVDPGKPGGHYESHFVGLEQPPGVRSDEPGRTYTLTAHKLGSIASGSPVFYRDVTVGEVLGYDMGDGLGPIKISIFIRAPFDNLVRPGSRFWDSSGIAFGIKGGVLQLQLQSLQAVIAGGITFNLPPSSRDESPSQDDASFRLYASQQQAESAAYSNQIQAVSYVTSNVNGLTPGSPVNALGIQVGDVTSVNLVLSPKSGQAKVRIGMQLLPQKLLEQAKDGTIPHPLQFFQRFVDNGMRVEIGSSNYVTGQKEINLVMEPKAKAPVKVYKEGNAIVLPFKQGGLDATLANAADITAKIDQMPFQEIGDNLNKLLKTANGTLGAPQVKILLTQLSATLKTADTTLQDIHQGFGQDSDFQRSLMQILNQTTTTLQSLQALATYLNQHPQSMIFGRNGS